jgi:DNA-binding transcriptional MerR regulator
MSKKAAPQRRVGGPVWKPGDPTLTVGEIAEALTPIAPDMAGTLHRIRHWIREQMLLPVGRAHAGAGRHRLFSADAIYDAAVLHVLTNVGVPVSGSRALLDGLGLVRFEIAKRKAGKGRKKPHLRILQMASGLATVGVFGEGEEIRDDRGFKVADVVVTIDIDLEKLFAQVKVPHERA